MNKAIQRGFFIWRVCVCMILIVGAMVDFVVLIHSIINSKYILMKRLRIAQAQLQTVYLHVYHVICLRTVAAVSQSMEQQQQ